MVKNQVISRIDILGLSAANKDSCCGPDVTDWFVNELNAHLKVWNDINGGMLWVLRAFKAHAATTPCKWIGFPSKTCNVTKDCKDTVTLKGKCIHKSELGNIVFGMIGDLKLPSILVVFGALQQGANGPDSLEDAAGIIAGFVLTPMAADGEITLAELKSALGDRSNLFDAWKENWKRPNLTDAPGMPLDDMAKKHVKCKPCTEKFSGSNSNFDHRKRNTLQHKDEWKKGYKGMGVTWH